MSILLPDVALTELSSTHVALDWVGMEGIDLPIMLDEPGFTYPVQARAEARVDLPDPTIKGIHMSRLYRLLDAFSDAERLSPVALARLLRAMVDSHADCHSRRARLGLSFSLLCRRPALLTEGLSGWKAYPARIEATWGDGQLSLEASVQVGYSSTCPCSAALTRQLIEQAFSEAFAASGPVDVAEVAAWLRANATLATPHSQRSVADVRVRLDDGARSLGLLTLVERIEAALGTPLQTAVKRADEQAFARLNGQNLMYVEDAARRLRQAIDGLYPDSSVSVRHVESLHPHDAVASSSQSGVSAFSEDGARTAIDPVRGGADQGVRFQG
ncbi:GTP cyclohydrolase FolE2 [Stutzerimonas kirkiae]|uniref:GTP cyclohydrolase FolE2 n=1 Tax=Stutzerimonas kirkiae TaxID=2211392 RepID=A0A4Q9REB5_9GAMM|nr:GTP cyclohydrolase FolE2 [Stutzerimonas kirkiae]TBV00087.1 GTP cyclohydrolase I FolE2 [Stutzerimonas kirkiae]TBV03430.1 GTP cyclohydrolase I FolE2 [Stutzerimonas kirkiae]TBV05793.1 GTP cyclohydrolase I FolE2 [Stutzerimonas kirkiae]TBV17331.1 GTP cyclohydrolase I FolE2 [Stutzerimonas kirkiae]